MFFLILLLTQSLLIKYKIPTLSIYEERYTNIFVLAPRLSSQLKVYMVSINAIAKTEINLIYIIYMLPALPKGRKRSSWIRLLLSMFHCAVLQTLNILLIRFSTQVPSWRSVHPSALCNKAPGHPLTRRTALFSSDYKSVT